MEALARACGREPHATNHQTWVSTDPSVRTRLPIPHHTTDLNKYTAQAMLDVLEDDLDRLAAQLKSKRGENGHG